MPVVCNADLVISGPYPHSKQFRSTFENMNLHTYDSLNCITSENILYSFFRFIQFLLRFSNVQFVVIRYSLKPEKTNK